MHSMSHLVVLLACLGDARPEQPNSRQIQGSAGHSLIRVTQSQSGLALLLLALDPAAFQLTHTQSPMGGRLHCRSQIPARRLHTSMRLDRRSISQFGYEITPMQASEVEEKANQLTVLQRRVAVEAGTEEAYTGETTNGYKYDDQTPGYYVGAVSGLPLFSTNDKFDSGTGWPSFSAAVDPRHVIRQIDPKDGREEVIDAISGAHLGHVFKDGPTPGGLRFCMNAAAFTFVPSEDGKVPRGTSKLGYDVNMMSRSELEEKAKKLNPFQRKVALDAGTEMAFTGKTTNGVPHDSKTPGYYVGAVSGLPLFSSKEKYDSGTGWPSFWAPVDDRHVICRPDPKDKNNPLAQLLMGGVRTEVIDAASGAHLGHVFPDGPRSKGGDRYCMNSAAFTFVPSEDGEVPRGDSIDS